jgi:hypothetical protein
MVVANQPTLSSSHLLPKVGHELAPLLLLVDVFPKDRLA